MLKSAGTVRRFLCFGSALKFFLSRDTEFKCIFKRLNAQMGWRFPKRRGKTNSSTNSAGVNLTLSCQ